MQTSLLTSKHSRSSFAFCCCLAKMYKIVISYFKRETNFGFLVKTESIVAKSSRLKLNKVASKEFDVPCLV